MKILSTNTKSTKTLSIAKSIARANVRKGYARYALVVFTSATSAHVGYFNADEIGLRAKAAAILRTTFAVIEMA